MVSLSELETEARLLENEADGLMMLARHLEPGARAYSEGQSYGLRIAAGHIRRMEDRVIEDAADYFADQELGEMKLEAAERADDGPSF